MTEEITGFDLVQAQIRIAGGATLEEIGIGKQVSFRPCCHLTVRQFVLLYKASYGLVSFGLFQVVKQSWMYVSHSFAAFKPSDFMRLVNSRITLRVSLLA